MTRIIFVSVIGIFALAACGHVAPADPGDGSADADTPDTMDVDGSTDGGDTTGETPTDTTTDTVEDVPTDTMTESDVPICTSDLDCSGGAICRPTCFGGDGCGMAPSSLDLSCPGSTRPDADAPCDIDLDGLEQQAACLECATEVGMVTLMTTDFNNPGGACQIDGWSLVSGDNCSEQVGDCTPINMGETCCGVVSTVLATLDGDCMLRSDRHRNCSDGEREVRAFRDVDTTGVENLEICFNVAEVEANDNEGILLYARDGSHDEQIWCLNGQPTPGNRDVDGYEWPVCVDLPTWAEDNSDLVLTFILHSHDDGDQVFVDDITVRGWPLSCTPTRVVAFEEDFDPCPASDPITDGWNGWTVTGDGGPTCEDRCTGSGGASVLDGTWTMSRIVDASALVQDVRLCFDVGGDDPDSGEQIAVSFDAGDGDGPQRAWFWEQEWGPDGTCQRVCIQLDERDPDVVGAAALQITLELTSNNDNRWVFIDDIVVDGAGTCDGAGVVDVGAISNDGSGDYSFDLTDTAGGPAPAWVTCSWDSPTPPVEDTVYTSFE